MLNELLFLLFISISHGCIPTTSVVTTTISPNVSTTTVASNVTTTTATVVDNCCTYPLNGDSINTANPVQANWTCNQTITFTCALSSYLNTTVYIGNGVAVNRNDTIGSTAPVIVPAAEVVGGVDGMPTESTITCDTTTRLWSISSIINREYYFFSCAYHLANGSYVTGGNLNAVVTA